MIDQFRERRDTLRRAADAVGLLFDMISHQNEFDKNSRISDE